MTYENQALAAAKMLAQQDVAHCQANYERNKNGQAERRCLIRSEFAFIEAWVYSCRYQSVFGEARKIPDRVPAIQNVEESLASLSTVLGSVFTVDKDDAGWCSMAQAYRVRDRITHPKSPSDLNVTDEDMKVFVRAVKWFAETAGKIEEGRNKASTTGGTVRR